MVRSLWLSVKPDRQLVHSAVPSLQSLHPAWHRVQSPVELRKKPEVHVEHLSVVPSAHPSRQSHVPLSLHSPLTQLHCLGSASSVVAERHCPLPDVPSSHSPHPSGHAVHSGPKKPAAHDSQDVPEKFGAQTHWPEALHTPAEEQAGEHDDDCISKRVSDDGRDTWVTSGMDSQRTTRSFALAPETDIQMFSDNAMELAVMDVDALRAGALGMPAKAACPE